MQYVDISEACLGISIPIAASKNKSNTGNQHRSTIITTENRVLAESISSDAMEVTDVNDLIRLFILIRSFTFTKHAMITKTGRPITKSVKTAAYDKFEPKYMKHMAFPGKKRKSPHPKKGGKAHNTAKLQITTIILVMFCFLKTLMYLRRLVIKKYRLILIAAKVIIATVRRRQLT